MKVSNRIENTQFGKTFILTVEVDGKLFEARGVWPPAYDDLDKKDAIALVERGLWHQIMSGIEFYLKGLPNG